MGNTLSTTKSTITIPKVQRLSPQLQELTDEEEWDVDRLNHNELLFTDKATSQGTNQSIERAPTPGATPTERKNNERRQQRLVIEQLATEQTISAKEAEQLLGKRKIKKKPKKESKSYKNIFNPVLEIEHKGISHGYTLSELVAFAKAQKLIDKTPHDRKSIAYDEFIKGALTALVNTPVFEYLNHLLKLSPKTIKLIDRKAKQFKSTRFNELHQVRTNDKQYIIQTLSQYKDMKKRAGSAALKEATAIKHLNPKRDIKPLIEIWSRKPNDLNLNSESELLDLIKEHGSKDAHINFGKVSDKPNISPNSPIKNFIESPSFGFSYPALAGFSYMSDLLDHCPHPETHPSTFKRFSKALLTPFLKTKFLTDLYSLLGFDKDKIEKNNALPLASDLFLQHENERYKVLRDTRTLNSKDQSELRNNFLGKLKALAKLDRPKVNNLLHHTSGLKEFVPGRDLHRMLEIWKHAEVPMAA